MKKKDNKNAFKTPEGYFEGVKDRLFDRLEEESTSLPQKDGFEVPEGYFDILNEKITTRVSETTETKVVQLQSYRKYYLAAASIAAIFLLVFGLQWFKQDDLGIDSLTSSDIQSYLEDIDLGLSSYEIAEVVAIDLEVNDILEDQLNDEYIIDYLDENIDDFDELNLDIDE